MAGAGVEAVAVADAGVGAVAGADAGVGAVAGAVAGAGLGYYAGILREAIAREYYARKILRKVFRRDIARACFLKENNYPYCAMIYCNARHWAINLGTNSSGSVWMLTTVLL